MVYLSYEQISNGTDFFYSDNTSLITIYNEASEVACSFLRNAQACDLLIAVQCSLAQICRMLKGSVRECSTLRLVFKWSSVKSPSCWWTCGYFRLSCVLVATQLRNVLGQFPELTGFTACAHSSGTIFQSACSFEKCCICF